MILRRVKISGFRSFAEASTLVPPAPVGLFLVRGENEDAPELGANGAGKSTLFDAVCWCFYGKTSRGLSGPAVESWHADGTDVSVRFSIEGRKHTVRRTRGPNALLLDGEDVDQVVVDDLLGLDYERFLHVVLLGQFGQMFCDLRPQQRLDLFTSVLGLERWADAAKRASEVAADLQAQQTEAEVECGRCESRLATLEDELRRTEEAHADALRYSKERSVSLQKRLQAAEAVHARRNEGLDASKKILAKWDKHHARRQAELEAVYKEQEAAVGDVDRHTGAFEATAPKRDGTCPTCGQVVHAHSNARHDSGAHAAARERMEAARKVLAAKAAASRDAAASFLRFVERRSAVVAAVERRAQLLQDAEAECRAADQAIEDEARRTDDQRRLTDQLQRLTRDVERAAWALTAAESAAFDRMQERLRVEEWVGRFREVRLWLVDEALAELTVAVNSALLSLGLSGWSVSFACERETQAGTVSRGFTIAVAAPHAPDGVPWDAWSGGETQRLRVACAAGLAELVHRRMPAAPTWEVWDEPTAHLGREGVEALVAFFAARAKDRQVWLIDHRSLDSGAFDAVVTVTKQAGGGSVVAIR